MRNYDILENIVKMNEVADFFDHWQLMDFTCFPNSVFGHCDYRVWTSFHSEVEISQSFTISKSILKRLIYFEILVFSLQSWVRSRTCRCWWSVTVTRAIRWDSWRNTSVPMPARSSDYREKVSTYFLKEEM